MLRSKQLLPFVKGARAWIVAGSVSKPTPLDGSGSSGVSEDRKAENGFNGTPAHHSARNVLYVPPGKDSLYRQGAKPVSASSAGSQFESSNSARISGPSLVRNPVITTASKNVLNVASQSAAVEHHLGETSGPADLPDSTLSAVGSVQTTKGPKKVNTLVTKSEIAGQEGASICGKVSEVGLATLNCISDEVPITKHGRISKVKVREGASNSGFSSELSGSTDFHNTLRLNVVTPVKITIEDNKKTESKSPLNSSVPFPVAALPASAGRTITQSNVKKSYISEDLKGGESAPKHTILFGTVDPALLSSTSEPNNLGAEVLDVKSTPCQSSAGSQHEVMKHMRPNAQCTSSDPHKVMSNRGQAQNSSTCKNSGSAKSREACAGISGSRRKASGLPRAGSTRLSNWSAKDSERESASNEMVEQVGSILKRMGWTAQTVDALANFNSRLRAYHINEVLKHQREPRLAWEFFSWAKTQSGYKHDVRTYTTMIGILGRARNFEACDRLMQDMRSEGCEPSVVTFNRLIFSYGSANYLREALNLFSRMKEIGCDPDRVTYCTLIDLHSKAGFHDIAMDICNKMWEAGFEQDTYSYTLVIHCLGKAGNLSAAYKMFLKMIERGCTPNLVTYNMMIDLHAKAGKHHMALKLYNDMQDAGYHPDNVTYSVIMEVLGHSGHMDEAENVFNEMEQAGWAADATTFGSMVYMWGQAGNLKKAREWYGKMLDSGLAPTVPTCNSLLWAHMQVNDYEAAEEVLESMTKWGLSPTLPTYTLLLSSCTTRNNQKDVDSILQIMGRTGHPAHSFLCTLLNTIDSNEIIFHIRQFFDSLHEEEHDSKRSFADALMEFFYRLEQKERAGWVWEVAVEKNFYPSVISEKAPNYWRVDLHVMSMGTAVVALLRTLARLRERMLSTGIIPDRIEIVTGWGRHSRVSGLSKIKKAVEDILGALHAPFYVDTSNVGCFVGYGQPLVDWLHRPDMDHMLAL